MKSPVNKGLEDINLTTSELDQPNQLQGSDHHDFEDSADDDDDEGYISRTVSLGGTSLPPILEDDVFDNDAEEGVDGLKHGAERLLNHVSTWLLPGLRIHGSEPLEAHLLVIDPKDFMESGRFAIRDVSRHYLAIAIACWMVATMLQGLSLGLMFIWSFAPIVIAMIVVIATVLVYWTLAWKRYKVPFKRLWTTPYPYGVTTAVLGCLAQHAVWAFDHGFNITELVVSFMLMQVLYWTLVAATYQQYMQRWSKLLRHRRLYNNAVVRKVREYKKHGLLYTNPKAQVVTLA